MAKKQPRTRSFAGSLFRKLAPAIGAKVLMEPQWKTVGQITFKNGVRKYFRYSSIDLNTLGASEISKDKAYAAFFMRKLGYPTVPGQPFYSDRWAELIGSKQTAMKALAYARRIGFPVIVKPNSKSQGKGVSLAYNERELLASLKSIFMYEDVALVQKRIAGADYRIVVLDDHVISAYERRPLSVIGDGRSTIKRLLQKKKRQFKQEGRDTILALDDPRIVRTLRHQKRRLLSVPGAGEYVTLLPNANLSSGGEALDVTDSIHADWRALAVRLTRDMGLRFCGLDVITEMPLSEAPQKYRILETNAAPGLDHYVRSGAKQRKTTEALYAEILVALGRP